MSNHVNNVLLVGTGRMAEQYAKVLSAMNIPFTVVGRSEKSCQQFTEKTNIRAISGGVGNDLLQNERINYAIVAVSVNQLAPVTLTLLKQGVRHILVEKPGGLINELKHLCEETKRSNANVYVAYNRRFYSSVRKAQQMIKDDGGLTSFTFSFTERSYLIENSLQPQEVKEQWFLANSTHVVDLAFFLGGKPINLYSFTKGSLSWHPRASVFSGAGMTENDVLFAYHANWSSPGNWGVNLFTNKHRLILEPLEQLKVQKLGKNEITEVRSDDEYDQLYKPGLYLQVQSFLSPTPKNLKSIFEQYEEVYTIYEQIVSGKIH